MNHLPLTTVVLSDIVLPMKGGILMRICLVFLLLISLSVSACMKSAQEIQGSPEAVDTPQDKSRLLGEVKISTPQEIYQANTAIPIRLELIAGKFDLLLARRYVVGDGAFANLVVTDATGAKLQPKQIISISKVGTRIYHEGQAIQAMPALELASGAKHTSTLDDLRELYELKPGTYQVQAMMHLPVYRGPKILKQSPAIAQLEEEITLINQDRKLNAGAKADAIADLRQQIQELRAQVSDEEREYYINTASLRGYADLESNVLAITVE